MLSGLGERRLLKLSSPASDRLFGGAARCHVRADSRQQEGNKSGRYRARVCVWCACASAVGFVASVPRSRPPTRGAALCQVKVGRPSRSPSRGSSSPRHCAGSLGVHMPLRSAVLVAMSRGCRGCANLQPGLTLLVPLTKQPHPPSLVRYGRPPV